MSKSKEEKKKEALRAASTLRIVYIDRTKERPEALLKIIEEFIKNG